MRSEDTILVYHGSDHIIQTPQYPGGKEDNDYGNGFYTTEYEERARRWAVLNGDPERSIVNKYELDLSGLEILDLHQCRMLAWAAEVISHKGTNQEASGILGNQIFLKSEKAFQHIKWLTSYESPEEKRYMEEDVRARREVNKFMQGRMRAILLEGYEVPGITARYAVQKKLVYHEENDYYE